MDFGLCPGNYFEYDDETIARNRENEIADDLEFNQHWTDSSFPIDGRSLYFDPLNPPKGALPQDALIWCRISTGDIINCNKPVAYVGNRRSTNINQGAIGNSYFINCLRLLACEPQYLNKIMVSTKHAEKGIYTFKFCKYGKWRYVHIDDYIPCRQSGRIHFSYNENPNETFAMLIEKAYAKLYGCYEALIYGLIEMTLYDFLPGCDINVFRSELPLSSTINKEDKEDNNNDDDDDICNKIWELLEDAVDKNKLIGCGRYVPDPYCEKPSDRQGISLHMMYQIVDICVASSEATSTLDALEVGLICIRNCQVNTINMKFINRLNNIHNKSIYIYNSFQQDNSMVVGHQEIICG